MKFIKLARYTKDGPIFIAIDKIETIQPTCNFEDDVTSTTITTGCDDVFEVKETPEQILEMINEPKKLNNDTLEQEIIDFKKKNSEFWEKDRKIRRDSYLNGTKYSNAGMEEFVGKPVFERRDGKDEIIGRVMKSQVDGKISYVLEKKINEN